MAVLYDVRHVTTYSYATDVSFGPHRAMYLPRTGGRGRILSHSVTTNLPSTVRWIMDAQSNAIALVDIAGSGRELSFEFRFRGIHYGVEKAESFPLEARAEEIPVQYVPDEWADLSHYIRPHVEDPGGKVAAWGRSMAAAAHNGSVALLTRMVEDIGSTFAYQAREAMGTQAPDLTLRTQSGTCRDFAWLMIEALRRLGFACRFVSGYLYDAALDGGASEMMGAGATHAWVQVYLPGAGWLNFDPTNRLTGGFDLIPVAIARHPAQAVPLDGSWFGDAKDYRGMSVEVEIRKIGTLSDTVA
jgi:transglutaminase-like putative cysteine protease